MAPRWQRDQGEDFGLDSGYSVDDDEPSQIITDSNNFRPKFSLIVKKSHGIIEYIIITFLINPSLMPIEMCDVKYRS